MLHLEIPTISIYGMLRIMYKESRESKSTSDGGEERVYEKMDDIDDHMYTFCSSNLMRRRYQRQDLRF